MFIDPTPFGPQELREQGQEEAVGAYVVTFAVTLAAVVATIIVEKILD